MGILLLHQRTIIATELLAAFESLLAAYKEERAFLFESALKRGAGADCEIASPDDAETLAIMDRLIERGDSIVRRAREVL